MTESEMITEAPERRERVQRKRGAGFPVVALPECVEVLRNAGKHGDEHSISAFATYLGHSTANSGSFKRRIAAFRDWKLIANATGDRVVFTDLGKRIAYPTDPAKERSDLQEAFENCTIFMVTWDESAKGVPIGLSTLANQGVKLGVSPVSKQQFAESLIESAAAAGFAELEGDKVVFIRPSDDPALRFRVPVPTVREADVREAVMEVRPARYRPRRTEALRAWRERNDEAMESATTEGSLVEELSQLQADAVMALPLETLDVADAPVLEPWERAPVEQKAATLYRQTWDTPGGSLTFEIRSNGSLPVDAFLQIGKVMSEIEKLKELLTKGTESEKTE